jgi:hypothetical protein
MLMKSLPEQIINAAPFGQAARLCYDGMRQMSPHLVWEAPQGRGLLVTSNIARLLPPNNPLSVPISAILRQEIDTTALLY